MKLKQTKALENALARGPLRSQQAGFYSEENC